MQVFDRETTDYIAREFNCYFYRLWRKRLSIKEARTIIDFVSEGSAPGFGSITFDYSVPRVKGGGNKKPEEGEVRKIMENAPTPNEWDQVFAELIDRCSEDDILKGIIYLYFKDCNSVDKVCDKLHISKHLFFKNRRIILSRAGVLAVKQGLISYS
jgi:hypothetical protein